MFNKKGIVLIITTLVILLGCSPKEEREVFTTFTPTENSWDEVLKKEKQDIEVITWNTGKINTPLKGLINLKHPNAPELEESRLVDVPAFLLKTPMNGNILIDSGLDINFKKDRLKYVSGLLANAIIPEGEQLVGQSVVERLKKEDVELSAMFFTHMHFDHTGGLVDIENPEFPIVVGKHEEVLELPLLLKTTHFEDIPDVKEFDFTNSKEMYPFKEVLDIYGDRSIFAINTNGHTGGHVTYLVNSKRGLYLLTGDQVNITENITYGVGPGNFSSDVDLAQVYFDQLMEFVKLYPETIVLMGHEL